MVSFIAKARRLVTVAFGIKNPKFVSFVEDMDPVHGFSEVILQDRFGRLFSVTAFPSGYICLKDLLEDDGNVDRDDHEQG